MKFWIGITDNDWYKYLAGIHPDEINFWRPSPAQPFRALEPGGLFLFKLHSPYNKIAGGAFFVRYTRLPLYLAWETFRGNNGAPTYYDFQRLIAKRRGLPYNNFGDPIIGCILLSNPCFFNKDEWIDVPKDFSPHIQVGKRYDSTEGLGKHLWEEVMLRFRKCTIYDAYDKNIPLVAEEAATYGAEYLAKVRIGQGAFRILVTDAYNRMCSITGEKTLPALDASHIKPYAESGPNLTQNGILLRSDLHRLFDNGYITISPSNHIEVSKRIKEEFDNGKNYYPYHGQKLFVLPDKQIDRPGGEFLRWHNENVYKG